MYLVEPHSTFSSKTL